MADLCGFPLSFGAGASMAFTCGSLILEVFTGPIEIQPSPDLVISVPSDTTVTVTTVEGGEIEVENSPDSEGTVIVVVLGDPFELDPGNVVATTPRGLKELALERLDPYSDESERIEIAIEEIEKSLERGWVDDNHLDPKDGKKVFDHEQKAVKELLKVVEDLGKGKEDVSSEALTALLASIDDLVAADRLLAATALDELVGVIAEHPDRQAKVDRELGKGLEELDKGDEEVAEGKADKAIDRVEKAWKHAVKAAKEAAKSSDDDDSSDDGSDDESSDDESSDDDKSSDDDSEDSGDDD